MRKLVFLGWVLPILFSKFFAFSEINIPELQQKYQVPNVAIAYIDDEKINTHLSSLEGYGIVGDTSLFQIASLSKTLFAVAVIHWAQANAVPLDSTLEELLKKYKVLKIPDRFLRISIRELLSHTSGIDEQNYVGYSSIDHCSSLIQSIEGGSKTHGKLNIREAKRGEFNYSGGNYTLLQHIIEGITGLDFDLFMRRYLFDIWGMGESFPNQQLRFQNRVMSPHSIFGRPIPCKYFSEQAAAGMISNVRGLGLFTKTLLDSTQNRIRQAMITGGNPEYGLGIEIDSIKDQIFLYHLGANFGWRAGIYMLPNLKQGLVILTNSESGFFLSNEILQDWLHSLGLTNPSIVQSAKYEENVALYGAFSFLAVFFCRAVFLIYQAVFAIRKKRFSLKRFSWLIILGVVGLIWYILLYTPYLPPTGWIIASFMPYNFLYFSIALFAYLLIECIYKLFPKTCDNQKVKR